MNIYLGCSVKGDYLDCLHLTELKNIYIYVTEIYMKKKVLIINN